MPMEVTISWPWFLGTFGVMFLAAVGGFFVWLVCRLKNDRVEPVHAVICILLIVAFFVVTPMFRLRWFEIFPR